MRNLTTLITTAVLTAALALAAAPAQAATLSTSTCGIGVAQVAPLTVHTVATETTALAKMVGRYKAGCDIFFLNGDPRLVYFSPKFNGGKWRGNGDLLTVTKLSAADVQRIIAKAGGTITIP